MWWKIPSFYGYSFLSYSKKISSISFLNLVLRKNSSFFLIFFQFLRLLKKVWRNFTSDFPKYNLHPLCYQKPTPKLKIEVLLLLQKLITDRKKHIIVKSIHSSLIRSESKIIHSKEDFYYNIRSYLFLYCNY